MSARAVAAVRKRPVDHGGSKENTARYCIGGRTSLARYHWSAKIQRELRLAERSISKMLSKGGCCCFRHGRFVLGGGLHKGRPKYLCESQFFWYFSISHEYFSLSHEYFSPTQAPKFICLQLTSFPRASESWTACKQQLWRNRGWARLPTILRWTPPLELPQWWM